MIVSIRDVVSAAFLCAGAAAVTLSQIEPRTTGDPWLLGIGVFLLGFGAHL